MTAAPLQDDRLRAVEALLAFWADAGVDHCIEDAPVDRLAAPARAAPVAAPARPEARPAPRAAAVASDRGRGAAELATAANSLDELAAAARTLFGAAAVGFEGTAPAALMVIGDAPTAHDEAEGAPFRGPRGALVRALLSAAGLGDVALYANTVFRRPPGGGDPDASAQGEAAPLLARAAALARPRAVLLLGGCAARGVAGLEGPILKLRGRWSDWSPEEGGASLPALVTLGPDLLLRQPAQKKAAWGDVLSLAARLLT